MANARKPTIPYDINYIEKYLMEGPIRETKTYYVSSFIESIKVHGTTNEKIKYAKKYINDKTYNFSLFSRNPEVIIETLNLFTNEKENEEKIRKLGIFLTPDDNLYFSQFFTENKVLPISNPELQYPAKKHQFIENLWIINSKPSKPSFDSYYSSLYRMIRCYRLEQQIEERIPGITRYIDNEIDFIEFLKGSMCAFVDNQENKDFIENLLSNIKSVNLKNNTNLRNITNIDNFRTSFRFKNSNPSKAYASEIEINVCCQMLDGIINDNRNYVLNKTTNPSQYTSNNTMTNYNYTGISQTNASQTNASQTPDNYLRIGNTSNNLFELAINNTLPFFYRNDNKKEGICMDWQGLITQSKIDEYNQEYIKEALRQFHENLKQLTNQTQSNQTLQLYNNKEAIEARRNQAQQVINNPHTFASQLATNTNTNTNTNTYNGLGGSYYKNQSMKKSRKQSMKKSMKKSKKQSRKQSRKKLNKKK